MRIIKCALVGVAGLFFTAAVFAQPGVVGSTGSAAPSSTGNTITFDYLGTGSTVVAGSFVLDLADMVGTSAAAVTVTGLTCNAAAGFTCPALPTFPATIAFFMFVEVASTTGVVTVTYDVGAGANNGDVVSVAVSMEAYGDIASTPIAPSGTVNGTINISTGPGPGVMDVAPPMVNLVNSVNGPAQTSNLTISNQGSPGDATLTAACSLGAVTGPAGVNLSVPAFNGMLAPAASQTRTVSCSGTVVGMATATYTCNGGAAGMDSSAVSCDVGVGVAVPDPSAGSMVNLLVGPVVRGGLGNGSQAFREIANAGAGYDVTCVVTDTGMGAFALNGPGMASVPAGGSVGIGVSGQSTLLDPQPTGVMTCTYSNGAMGTVVVGLGIALIPEIVPTLSQWGLILLVLGLAGFGVFSLRRRMNAA